MAERRIARFAMTVATSPTTVKEIFSIEKISLTVAGGVPFFFPKLSEHIIQVEFSARANVIWIFPNFAVVFCITFSDT
jgi:hypothetical protein